MEIPETKRFIPKGFELGTTLSKLIWAILTFNDLKFAEQCKLLVEIIKSQEISVN